MLLSKRIPCFKQVLIVAENHVKSKRFDFQSLSGWLLNKIPGEVSPVELQEVEELSGKLLSARTDKELSGIKYSYL